MIDSSNHNSMPQESRHGSEKQSKFAVFLSLTIIGSLGILLGSWAPFQLTPAGIREVWMEFVHNGIAGQWSRSDVVINFWIGIPAVLGCCGLLQIQTGNSSDRAFKILAILLLQATVSLLAEIGQGWMANRVSSLSDFGFQMAGAVVAILCWNFFYGWIESQLRIAISTSKHYEQSTRLDAILGLTSIGILIWTIMPLDVITSPAELLKEAVKTEWVPFTRFDVSVWGNIYQWMASTLLAIPIALWISRWLVRSSRTKRSWFSVALIGAGVGLLPELAQFPIDSRVASATDALFGTIGATIGLLIGSQFRQTGFQFAETRFREAVRTPGFWLLLATFQIVLICLIAWMPFDFTNDTADFAKRLKQLQASPFIGNRGSDLLNGLTMFRQAILAAVFGVFAGLALRSAKLGTFCARLGCGCLLVCLLVMSAGVEFVQVIVDSRVGDASGTFIRFAGSIIGLIAAMTLSRQATPAQ